MTLEQFRQNIELKKEMEFTSRGINFSISYGRDDDGKNYIAFGEKHLPYEKYYSWGEFINAAKIGNAWLRYSVEDLVFSN